MKLPIEKKGVSNWTLSDCVCVFIEHHQKRRRRRLWFRNGRCLVVFSLAFSSLCFRTVNQVPCFKKKQEDNTTPSSSSRFVYIFTHSCACVCVMHCIVLHVYVSLESNRITPHSHFPESHFQFLEKRHTLPFSLPFNSRTWPRRMFDRFVGSGVGAERTRFNMVSSVKNMHTDTHTSLSLLLWTKGGFYMSLWIRKMTILMDCPFFFCVAVLRNVLRPQRRDAQTGNGFICVYSRVCASVVCVHIERMFACKKTEGWEKERGGEEEEEKGSFVCLPLTHHPINTHCRERERRRRRRRPICSGARCDCV